ncbi:MAG TPA: nitric-oxide reductase large subunit [Candidatus Sumerlaeota bacterium]|nr:nitric-oxide reductase large subunit [Candidatus Sumerlaeota bacterium]
MGPKGEISVNIKFLWSALAAVLILSLAVLGYYGWDIYRKAPPIPERIVSEGGEVLYTKKQILDGQNVWQSMGGQQVGSIWGHGAYVAPDWSADWLHREALILADHFAQREFSADYAPLGAPAQSAVREHLKSELRTNTYNPETGDIVVSAPRAAAIHQVAAHYNGLFADDASFAELRKAYAIKSNSVPDAERREAMMGFFFWASWSCAAERPGSPVSYTNNWPAEPLIDNRPTGPVVIWSILSFVALLAGVGGLAWYMAVLKEREAEHETAVTQSDNLLSWKVTPSMRATLKYFWVVCGMILVQLGMGMVAAHYGVEGDGFYGFPLQDWLPYAVVRTWHTQLGVLWIATAWLATGLFLAPAVSGHEPKGQRFLVNVLFSCLLIIVAGSMVGQWFAVQQRLGFDVNFWFGHQGYEYVDLGRFWQLFLFAGLFIWLALMGRALWPALRQPSEHRSLIFLFFLSSLAIALFYAAGLMWGRHTHLAMAEYWRWWGVHLWVEGFFEVFATVVIAFLFTRMGLLKTRYATAAVLFSTVIFLAGGMIGTFHHLYFSGTPTAVLALGATFSALEIVPLVLVGFEAYENYKLTYAAPWVRRYRWPIYFFVAVAFWNLVGAGLFGFLINPPIALYYMQGLNTTPVHGHTALFGVYGMLGIGLMLFCLRAMDQGREWRTAWLNIGFWGLNVGLALMVLISLLPIGLLQTVASIESGLWLARSAEFMQQPHMQVLRWLRVPGDVVFAIGMTSVILFVFGLKGGWSLAERNPLHAGKSPEKSKDSKSINEPDLVHARARS